MQQSQGQHGLRKQKANKQQQKKAKKLEMYFNDRAFKYHATDPVFNPQIPFTPE